jgi:hypothetical protein
MRIAAMPGSGTTGRDRIVVAAMQNPSRERGVGGLSDARTLRDQHRDQYEQPHGNEPNPQE